ncbi:MAG: class I SAM-dependent methyltransferase [Oxalobacteraceae bacterium]|nr:MAG: class I SAM-dependent methyltransferase [Oxalobacteraceae bacterium]
MATVALIANREAIVVAMDYYRVLKQIHAIVQPRTYVEIGVRHGESWQLVGPDTHSIGIDPAPAIRYNITGNGKLFEGTSDAFFAQYDPRALLEQMPIDLAFIDGMHLFENALTDFINIERSCHPGSHILIHDCLPIDAVTSARERTTAVWSGDVWKLIVCLTKERPDLRILVLDTAPTGLAVVTNCDPKSTHLSSRLDTIKQQYTQVPYATLGDEQSKRALLRVCPADTPTLEKIFAPAPVSREPAEVMNPRLAAPARSPALAPKQDYKADSAPHITSLLVVPPA